MQVRAATTAGASLAASQQQPLVVFVHGLDSSKETWTSVQSELDCPSLAVDLRGHGEADLGDISSFTAENLARDVIRAVDKRSPWILVGHSMGGRVAMRIAAIVAEGADECAGAGLAACVVEDMDLSQRSAPLGDLPPFFSRRFDSWPLARDALVDSGYDPKRVESWKDKRIRENDDESWWSDINPQAQWLARQRVLASDDADNAWDTLAQLQDSLSFSLSLWVADDDQTVCKWDGPGGIHDMKKRLPAANVAKFHNAAHSIHGSQRADFLSHLQAIVDSTSSA